jgi:hypothetical protein
MRMSVAEMADAGQDGGDWSLRGMGVEDRLARMSEDTIDAANRAQRQNPNFPGWQLYTRVVLGDFCFDRQLAAYAIALARAYSRTRKLNGRAVVGARYRGNEWLTICAYDALEFVIFGRYSASAPSRHEQLGVDAETYAHIRNTLAACLGSGLEDFRSELQYMLRKVEAENRRARFYSAIERAAA